MILSVSRRTDIPNYYSDWFFNRIKAGYLYVKNPVDPHQVSLIDLSPEVIDCIVFWTKNPENMLKRLDEIKAYQYYFQFTITGYGRDIEPGIPDKNKMVIPTFKGLSEKIGKDRMIWRYDPILINDKYTADYHISAFAKIAKELRGYTDKVIISFIHLYEKTKKNTRELNLIMPDKEEKYQLAAKMKRISENNRLVMETCAEEKGFEAIGIPSGCCIDQTLIESLIECAVKGKKDKNQRQRCGCFESVDIGTYHTCRNGCRYCYANFSEKQVQDHSMRYDPYAPLLCGSADETKGDRISHRKMKSLRQEQLTFFREK